MIGNAVGPQKFDQRPVTPPRGSVANVVTAGSPDRAGNTPVVQIPGPKPPIGNAQQVQAETQEAAPMPGGVSGGGRAVMPNVHHLYYRGPGSSSSFVSTVVKAPVSWLVLVLLCGLALVMTVWKRERRRALALSRLKSRSTGSHARTKDRPLVDAEKGDGS